MEGGDACSGGGLPCWLEVERPMLAIADNTFDHSFVREGHDEVAADLLQHPHHMQEVRFRENGVQTCPGFILRDCASQLDRLNAEQVLDDHQHCMVLALQRHTSNEELTRGAFVGLSACIHAGDGCVVEHVAVRFDDAVLEVRRSRPLVRGAACSDKAGFFGAGGVGGLD